MDKTRWKPAVLSCKCLNKFQDERYGAQLRLHAARGEKYDGQFRCTACGNVRTKGGT